MCRLQEEAFLFDHFYLLSLSKRWLFQLLAVLNKKQDDQGFLFLIVSYEVLMANSITSTTDSREINLTMFLRSTTKILSKLGNSILHQDVSHGFKESQGEKEKGTYYD